ncbi:MAG: hypothetical protein Tsb0020_23490 [Haliangiales bacterium]
MTAVSLVLLAFGVCAGACQFDTAGLSKKVNEAKPPPPNTDVSGGCNRDCHGDSVSTAPPIDLSPNTPDDTTRRGVGAHRSHTDRAPVFHRRVECDDCHKVPVNEGDAGHLDGDNIAEVIFSDIAKADGVDASWDPASGTCVVYCHGASLDGGALNRPVWTKVDGTQAACGNCHGYPPDNEDHPDPAAECAGCHPTVKPGVDLDFNSFLDADSHIDGVVQATEAPVLCDSCHGRGGESAPPIDLDGNEDRGDRGVGAHRQHVGGSTEYRTLECAQCHKTVIEVGDPDHLGDDNVAEMTFDNLAGDAASYDFASATCSNVYCHSDGGATFIDMVWTDDIELQCDSCHDDGNRNGASELSGEHRSHIEDGYTCNDCHDNVIDPDDDFKNQNLHVNGDFDVALQRGGAYNQGTKDCSGTVCHDEDAADKDLDDIINWIDDGKGKGNGNGNN